MPELRELLHDEDPAAHLGADELAPREDVLARILAERPRDVPPRPRGRRSGAFGTGRLAATAAALAAAALVAIAAMPGSDDDDERAISALVAAAGVAEAEAAPARGVVHYSLVETASLTTVGDRPPYSALVPRRSEMWVRPDGSGRIVTRTGDPVFPGPRDRARWEATGRPSLSGAPARSDERVPPGGFGGPADAGLPPSADLPTDPGALRSRLEAVARGTDVPVPVKTFELAAAILAQADPPAALRAALYRVVAGLEGVRYDGRARDPRGRSGISVSIDSDYSGAVTRQVLYFDPRTSRPLAATEELREAEDWVDGRTIGYALTLERGDVGAVGDRPGGR